MIDIGFCIDRMLVNVVNVPDYCSKLFRGLDVCSAAYDTMHLKNLQVI